MVYIADFILLKSARGDLCSEESEALVQTNGAAIAVVQESSSVLDKGAVLQPQINGPNVNL